MAAIPNDDPDDIDTTCMGAPSGDGTAGRATCGNTAATFVRSARGYRVYLCERHATRLTDFADDIFDDGRPTVKQCGGCGRYVPSEHAGGGRRCRSCRGD